MEVYGAGLLTFFNFMDWGELKCNWYVGHYLVHCSRLGRSIMMSVGNWWNDWQGEPKYQERTCRIANLPTTVTK
jgi:hypothetical protein